MKNPKQIQKFTLVAALALVSGQSAFSSTTQGFPATPEDLKGAASLNCSGALVRLNRGPDQPAVLLTNGHCARTKFIAPGTAIVDQPYDRSEIKIFFGAATPELVAPNRILYATMTDTDIALIELKATYRALEAKGAKVYELSESNSDSKDETSVQLVSGFHQQKQLCTINHIVPKLAEDAWTYTDALALTDPCPIEGGWAGTPLMDPQSQKIVAILNSSNREGGLCSVDNPCEVSSKGERMAFRGRAYAQRTTGILDCVNGDGEIKLSKLGCKLTKPKKAPTPNPTPTGKPPAPNPPSSSWPSKAVRSRSP